MVNGVDSDNTHIQNMEPEKCEGWEWVDVDELPDNMFCDTYNKIKEYVTLPSVFEKHSIKETGKRIL